MAKFDASIPRVVDMWFYILSHYFTVSSCFRRMLFYLFMRILAPGGRDAS